MYVCMYTYGRYRRSDSDATSRKGVQRTIQRLHGCHEVPQQPLLPKRLPEPAQWCHRLLMHQHLVLHVARNQETWDRAWEMYTWKEVLCLTIGIFMYFPEVNTACQETHRFHKCQWHLWHLWRQWHQWRQSPSQLLELTQTPCWAVQLSGWSSQNGPKPKPKSYRQISTRIRQRRWEVCESVTHIFWIIFGKGSAAHVHWAPLFVSALQRLYCLVRILQYLIPYILMQHFRCCTCTFDSCFAWSHMCVCARAYFARVFS